MSGHADALTPQCKTLPVQLDYVPDELTVQAQTELHEDDNTRVESLKELRTLLQKEEGLHWQDDDLFLLAFLRARKFDINRTFNLVKSFYNCLGKRDRIFYRLTFDDLRRLMEVNGLYILPHRDTKGSVVVCYRYCVWDPSAVPVDENLVLFSLSLMQELRSSATQIAGFQFIVDFKGFSINHVLHTTPSVLFVAEILQNSVPMRVKGLHVVNQNSFFYYFWEVIKRFLSKKLRDRVHLHGKDFKSLHKSIPPDILPADLGGDMPLFDNTDFRERMEASEDYLKHICSHGYEKYLGDY